MQNIRADPSRPQDFAEELNRDGPPQIHRVTNFCIDNILRPDFGRQKKARTLGRERSSSGRCIQREERAVTKSPKSQPRGGDLAQEDKRGTSEEQQPDCEARRPRVRAGEEAVKDPGEKPMLWPAWVYCTRYSDRPSSGPRSRKPRSAPAPSKEDKRPRTAFTAEQLLRLRTEFQKNRYLTEQRRQGLAQELSLSESQIKIWFQNKRAKIKKNSGNTNSLAQHLMAQGLYNHASARDGASDSD